MVPLIGVLLAALGPALVQSQPPPVAAPLNLTVYYEALCPDSRDFVVRQLEPLWRQVGAGDTLSLTFVPWGKAWEKADARGPYITCQHGPEECWGNRLHGCVLSQLAAGGPQLAAVSCLLRNYRQLRRAAPYCVRAAGLDWGVVSRCASSDTSLEAALAFGRRTGELQPPLSFVPTMTVDGAQDGQRLMLIYLELFICETWRQRTGQTASGCPAVFG